MGVEEFDTCSLLINKESIINRLNHIENSRKITSQSTSQLRALQPKISLALAASRSRLFTPIRPRSKLSNYRLCRHRLTVVLSWSGIHLLRCPSKATEKRVDKRDIKCKNRSSRFYCAPLSRNDIFGNGIFRDLCDIHASLRRRLWTFLSGLVLFIGRRSGLLRIRFSDHYFHFVRYRKKLNNIYIHYLPKKNLFWKYQ